jgi:Ca2+/Na+ antiporter
MFAYYGLDWIATFALWGHIYLLGSQKSRWVWPLGILAGVCFLILGLMTATWGTVVNESVVIPLMCRSWYKWTREVK